MHTGNRERGQILVLVALAMVVLIAMVGLVIDGGVAWEKRREAQNAADLAALAGTRVVAQSVGGAARTNQDVYNAISAIATANNGATVPGLGTATGAVYVDSKGMPIGGSYVTNAASAIPTTARGVKVPTSRSWTPFFLGLVGISNWSASADATARTTVGAIPVCVFCVIGNSVPFSLQSGAKITVDGGAVGSNSSLDLSSGGKLLSTGAGAGITVYSGGTSSVCGSPPCQIAPVPGLSSSVLPDPLAFLPDPVASGPNQGTPAIKGPGTTTTLNPGIYGGLTIEANATAKLNPGTYYFTGDISIQSNGALTGTGVTLVFLADANYKPQSNAVIQLAAPATGPYANLLFYFSRTGQHTMQMQSSSTSSFTGTIYGKNTFLDMQSGTTGATVNSMVVVGSVNDQSNSTFAVTYNGNQNVQLPGGPAGLVQ